MDGGRVLVLGLDGATLDLMGPWMRQGRLPNFARIARDGACGPLASTIPPTSTVSWASFITGKNPGKHGITDIYLRRGSYTGTLVNASFIDGESLWALLSGEGRRVGVLYVPMTYPPERVNGFLVSGLFSPPRGTFTYPPELGERLRVKPEDYRRALKIQYVATTEDAYIERIVEITDAIAEDAIELMRDHEWDFYMLTLYFVDQVQHFFWKYMPDHPARDRRGARRYGGVILEYYREMDAILGRMLREVDEDVTVIIMSDHGAGPLYKIVHINHWLGRHGLLRLRGRSGRGLRSVEYWLGRLGIEKETALELFLRFRSSVFARAIPSSLFVRALNRAIRSQSTLGDVDWSRTRAYTFGHLDKVIINLKGRDPQGVVEPGEEYERLREYLIGELYRMRDPETGERVVERVYRPEEIYEGPHTREAPDLILVMREGYLCYNDFDLHRKSPVGRISIRSGSHRTNGVLLMKGPSIRRGVELSGARIYDLMPTILYLMGVPIPRDVDGRVLTEALSPDFVRSNPIRYGEAAVRTRRQVRPYTAEEEEEMKRRLRGLGYMV